MKDLIRRILKEDRVSNSLIKMVKNVIQRDRKFQTTFWGRLDDEYSCEIEYQFSDKTNIWKEDDLWNTGKVLPYGGTIYINIISIRVDGVNQQQDDMPSYIWKDDLIDDIDKLIKPLIGGILEYDIDFVFKLQSN